MPIGSPRLGRAGTVNVWGQAAGIGRRAGPRRPDLFYILTPKANMKLVIALQWNSIILMHSTSYFGLELPFLFQLLPDQDAVFFMHHQYPQRLSSLLHNGTWHIPNNIHIDVQNLLSQATSSLILDPN